MSVRLGINGFGRMGRLGLRAAWQWPEFDIVHLNEIQGGTPAAAHLLEFDTVHGRWDQKVEPLSDNSLLIGDKTVTFSEHTTPDQVPWQDLGIDLVLECTGQFRTPEALQPYFEAGVKNVIVASPVSQDTLNLVVGCNDELFDPQQHHLVTAASCTTNCLAPIIKVIHQGIGIEHGMITTLHNATNTQVVVDAPRKDLRRARSTLNSLIPTTTGSAQAITMIYPELEGKLNGIAVRVPLLNASLTDCVFEVQRSTTVEEVNSLLENAAHGSLQGILGFESKPLVSADFVNDTRSAVVDGPATMVLDHTQVKVLAWYDNETGYANRMMEIAKKIALSLSNQ